MGTALDVALLRGPLATPRANGCLYVIGFVPVYMLFLVADRALFRESSAAAGAMLALVAWGGHTMRSALVRDALTSAWDSLGIFKRAAASDLDVAQDQLSRQLSGTEHFSLWRLANMSDAAIVRFALNLLTTFGGGRYVVLEKGPITELISTVETQASLLSMALGMSPVAEDETERVA